MVFNIGALKSSQKALVKRDIEGVVESADGMIVKVIIETALLTDHEKIEACIISKEAGADYVKTSTGIGYPGANVHDVKLIRETVGPDMGVKASGGIRNLKTTLDMIKCWSIKDRHIYWSCNNERISKNIKYKLNSLIILMEVILWI